MPRRTHAGPEAAEASGCISSTGTASPEEETAAQAYRYVRTGTNHYSLASIYDCVAWSRELESPSKDK